MECVVEVVSPTRKKIVLSLTAAEVNAAIDKGIADYRKDLALPGFRKGKVPASTVEHRFGDEIRSQAAQDTVNAQLGIALENEKLEPVSGVQSESASPFKRDEAFTCTLSFDVLPTIDFPNYDGLEVDQAKAEMSEEDINDIMDRLRENLAELTEVTEARLPQDGDTVDVDYAGFDENGVAVPDVKGEHFQVRLGQKQSLDDFEALVKTAKVGETKEGPVVFPADYGHAPLAGKTVTFHIKVNAIKTSVLPEVNDEFAKKSGHDDVEKLRAAIVEHGVAGKANAARGEAMKKLVDGLLAQVTFDIPESMLENRIARSLQERSMRLRRMGKSMDDLGKSKDELREEAKGAALEILRPQIFLMAIAQKESLSVAEQEIEMAMYTMAMRAGEDYKQLREAYIRSGLIHELRDRILADKAMELIYSKAKIKETEPQSIHAPAATAE